MRTQTLDAIRFLTCSRFVLVVLGLLIASSSWAKAQDFRIYTRVFDESQATDQQQAPVIGRSLSIYHAGRVYDYMDEPHELVILDTIHERFLIISLKHQKSTTVEFAQLNQFMRVATKEAESLLTEFQQLAQPDSLAQAKLLQFQLQPNFETLYEAEKLELRCESPLMNYVVQGVKADPVALKRYIKYADATAQLNSILHPNASMPAPRILLNSKLQEHNLLPTRVSLTMSLNPPAKLRAEHSIRWSLDAADRDRIAAWESHLRSPHIEHLSFHDYQRTLFNSLASGK